MDFPASYRLKRDPAKSDGYARKPYQPDQVGDMSNPLRDSQGTDTKRMEPDSLDPNGPGDNTSGNGNLSGEQVIASVKPIRWIRNV